MNTAMATAVHNPLSCSGGARMLRAAVGVGLGVGDAVGAEGMPEEGAHGGELAADRGRRELPAAPPAAEPRDVLGEDAYVDRLEIRALLLEPRAELPDVAAVRAPGGSAQRRRGEEATGCGASVHARRFPGYGPFPLR